MNREGEILIIISQDKKTSIFMAHQGDDRRRDELRAAIFVDYENIHHTLNLASESRNRADELIAEMIDALQRSLIEERNTRTVVSRAYADFTRLPGGNSRALRTLYARGVEPLFVPSTSDAPTVELQLCVDAMDLLHHRADITTFVLLTGRRTYLPLIQVFKRYGRRVLVVGTEEPRAMGDEPHLDPQFFFPARDLLSATSRRGYVDSQREFDLDGAPRANGEYRTIEDPTLIRALEIIEEHFGQYEEVYLTPLLRKMSDLLDADECDPKAIVSDLEDHRAVRLEKRSGVPHDYTVLILDDRHPDVARVRDAFAGMDSLDYDYGDEADEPYTEDYRYDGI